jgi:hypothetical protein
MFVRKCESGGMIQTVQRCGREGFCNNFMLRGLINKRRCWRRTPVLCECSEFFPWTIKRYIWGLQANPTQWAAASCWHSLSAVGKVRTAVTLYCSLHFMTLCYIGFKKDSLLLYEEYYPLKPVAYGMRDVDRVFWKLYTLLPACTSSGAYANERGVVYCVS